MPPPRLSLSTLSPSMLTKKSKRKLSKTDIPPPPPDTTADANSAQVATTTTLPVTLSVPSPTYKDDEYTITITNSSITFSSSASDLTVTSPTLLSITYATASDSPPFVQNYPPSSIATITHTSTTITLTFHPTPALPLLIPTLTLSISNLIPTDSGAPPFLSTVAFAPPPPNSPTLWLHTLTMFQGALRQGK